MFSRSKALVAKFAAPLLIASVFGCGSSTSNNDQGVTFAALGYFADVGGGTGLAGVGLVLSPNTVGGGLFQDLTDETSSGLLPVVYMKVENRLRSQFLRVTKIDCDYAVPGSSLSVPSDSFLQGVSVSPNPDIGGPQIGGDNGSGGVGIGGGAGGATAGGATGGGTTAGSGGLADGGPATAQGGTANIGFPLVGTDIIAYLNNHRAELPAFPFRMEALCSATAISTAGDVFETNPLGMQIFVIEDPGFGSGGEGGDFDGFDGGDTGAGDGGGSTSTDNTEILG